MKRALFFKLFPPPKYLDTPNAGLDISDGAVRAILLSQKARASSVRKYLSVPLDPNALDDGTISDEPALTKILSGVAKQLPTPFVHVSLPEEKVYIFRTRVLRGPYEQMSQIIESRLEENVPVSPAEAIFSFDVVPEVHTTDSSSSLVSVFVVPRKVIDTYIKVLQDANLIPTSFYMQGQAIGKSLITEGSKEESSTVLIVHVMSKKVGLYILYKGVVCFASTVTRTLISTVKEVGFAAADAYDVKREFGRVVTFWSEHGEGKKNIEYVIVSGADSLGADFYESIAPTPEVLSLMVKGNAWANVFKDASAKRPIPFEESLDYAPAIGLALLG